MRFQIHFDLVRQASKIQSGRAVMRNRVASLSRRCARNWAIVALSRSPEDFAAFLNEDAKFWVRLVKESGAMVD
jgi:hypothetical protein